MVTPQQSLSQLLEALRPFQAPVKQEQKSSSPPSVAPINEIIAEGKDEVGPKVIITQPSPIVKVAEPMVSALPASSNEPGKEKRKRPHVVSPEEYQLIREKMLKEKAEQEKAKEERQYLAYTDEQLKRMVTRKRDEKQAGTKSLESVARDEMGLSIPTAIRDNKEAMISFIKSNS